MKRNGMSLIETLVAMTLVLGFIGGTAELLGLSMRTQRSAAERLALASLAFDQLEELKSRPFDDPGTVEGGFSIPLGRDRGKSARLELTLTAVTPHLKRIGLRAYPEHHPERSLETCLFVSRHLGF